jgi:hypothetical protein
MLIRPSGLLEKRFLFNNLLNSPAGLLGRPEGEIA